MNGLFTRGEAAAIFLGLAAVMGISAYINGVLAGVAIADNGRERYTVCDTTGLWYDQEAQLLVVGRDLDGDGETDNRVRFTTNYHIHDDQGKECE